MSLNSVMYNIIRPIGGLEVARYFARKHPRIIMYHRLSENGLHGAHTPAQFREQMVMIKKYFNPLLLNELLDLDAAGEIPDHAVSITFDDGYDDFARFAFPILRELEIPVTLFITTGFINGDLWLWPDQLRYALQSTKINSMVDLPNVDFSLDFSKNIDQAWNLIADHCLTLNNQEKNSLISEVYKLLDVSFPEEAPELYQPLCWNQIRELIEKGVEIGSHSHSHPIMTKLSDDELCIEVELSKSLIERETGEKNFGFCYPNGQLDDFKIREETILREASYRYAVAAFPGRNPLKSRWSINRYPASTSKKEMEKTVYGLKYLNL